MVGVTKAKPRLSYATLASTLVGIVLISGCVREGAALVYQTKPSSEEHIPPASAVKKESEVGMTGRDTFDKMTLWTKETQLRGANIYQVQIYSDIHGSEFMGPGPVGPPYTMDVDITLAYTKNATKHYDITMAKRKKNLTKKWKTV